MNHRPALTAAATDARGPLAGASGLSSLAPTRRAQRLTDAHSWRPVEASARLVQAAPRASDAQERRTRGPTPRAESGPRPPPGLAKNVGGLELSVEARAWARAR